MNNESIKVPLYSEMKDVTNFEVYIYGTKDAEEQKQDSFSKALKRYADDIGISAGELTNLTGISKSAVNYYFSGERQVGFNTLIALCLALRLHPLRTKYLFEFTHFKLRKSDSCYYVIKEYLSGCAYEEKFNLYTCQMRLKDKFPLEYNMISDYFLSGKNFSMLELSEKYNLSLKKVEYRLKKAKKLLKEYVISHENNK